MGVDRPDEGDPRWLRLGPAARLLGVSINTLRRWSDSGRITCYRSAGGHRRFRRVDLEAILAQHAAGGGGNGAKRRPPAAPLASSEARMAPRRPRVDDERDRLQARNLELELLVSAGIEDSAQQSIESVLHSVSRRLSSLTNSPVVDIYAVQGDDIRALVSYDHGEFDLSWQGTNLRLADFPHSHLAATERRICVAASLDDPILTEKGRRSLEKYGYQSQLSSPLVSGGAVIGLLELSDYSPRDFAECLELVGGLSLFAARALENATLMDRLRRRTGSLHELVELGALVSGAHDVTELLRLVAQHMVTTLRIVDCDLFTLEGDMLMSRVSYDRDGFDEIAIGHRLRVEDFPTSRRAIETQDMACISSLDDPELPASEREIFERFGFQSSLTVPLIVDGVVRGLMDIYDDKPTDFAEYRDFLTTVGRLVAGALQKALLLERLEQGNQELRLLVDSGLEFASSLDLDEVLYSAAERMRSLTDARSCEIYHLDKDELVTVMSVESSGRDLAAVGMRYPLASLNMTAEVLDRLEPVVIENAMVDERLSPQERDYWIRWGCPSSLRLPLIVQGVAIGIVAIYDNRPREFEHIELLQGLAQTAAQALENARLLEQSRNRSAVLRELVELGAVVWRTPDVSSLITIVAQRLTATIDAAACDIFRLDDDGLHCLVSYDTQSGFDEAKVGTPLDVPEAFPSTFAALESREPIVIASRDDPRLTDHERDIYAEWEFESELVIPLAIEDRAVGFIDIFDTMARDFGEYVDFIRTVGQMVAGAFENAALLERLNDTNRELETLVQSGLEFGSSLDLEEVLGSIAARMRAVSAATCCEVYSLDGDVLNGRVSVDGDGVDAAFPGTTYELADVPRLTEVVRTGAPVLTSDGATDERLGELSRAEWAKWGYKSSLDLPLMIGGNVAGFVCLFDTRPRRIEHIELLQGLAQIAAQALANATLYSQLDESTQRLVVVNEASLDLASTLDFDDVLQSTARRLCTIADAPGCEIHVIEGSDLRCVVGITNGKPSDWEGTVHPLDEGYSEKLAVATRSTVMLSSIKDPRRSPHEVAQLKAAGFESQLIVPLIAKDKVIGIAEVLDPRRRTFGADVVATFESVCRAAALAIDNANLFEGMQMRRRETELLNAIARRTAASLKIDEIAAATVEELRQLIPFDRASMVIKDDLGRLASIFSSDRWIGSPEYIDAPPPMLEMVETLRRKRVVVWDAEGAMPFAPDYPAMTGVSTAVSIALMRGEELVGIFSLGGAESDGLADVDRRLLERVGTHLSLAINNARLYEEIKRMHLGNLKALSSALNAKDYYTLGHAARVAAYMVLLGHELGWTEGLVSQVEEVAYLHDIGKIGVADRVLLKPGGLNEREWELMRQHPIFSADIIRPLFGDDLVLGVRHHHERWDGKGYPDGLAGARIPLVARAMCVVDSYDAMSFRRPYRQALWYHEARAELERCRGRHFDPEMVGAFLRVLDRLEAQRDHARAVATEAAARIDASMHVRLREPADEDSDDYRHLAAILRDVRDANPPVEFLTTHARSDDKKFMIVVDCEEVPEKHSPLGSEIFADEELPAMFAGGTPDVNVLYVDEFGVDVIGLAPILDEQGEVVAVVSADEPPAGATGSEMEGLRSDVAQTFASMLQTTAARLSRAELDAITDGLTGVYNHRYLHERLSEELERSAELNSPLSLLFCDIDEFKRFNDTHGHSAGDAALRGVARTIEKGIRHIDLAARYGGEEFAVILIDTDADGAREVAERIRHDVAEAQFLEGKQTELTISIGIAAFPAHAERKEELLDKADWAMYLAKRRGRDRVMTFSAGERAELPQAVASGPTHGQLAMLAQLVDDKDEYAVRRSESVAEAAAAIARALGANDARIDDAIEAGRLCDIGMLGVPDEVVNKPDGLSESEWTIVREHPVTGERLLRGLREDDHLALAVAHHHERFDGSGYPAGLAGDDIPLTSRIVLVAAAYVAMTTPRAYRTRLTVDQALTELRNNAGSQFDPQVVAAAQTIETSLAMGAAMREHGVSDAGSKPG